MKGGDWFVVLLIVIELGAAVSYGAAGRWSVSGMWASVSVGNLFFLLTSKGIGNGN